MKRRLNARSSRKWLGFTLMEVCLSLGIAAGWILLALGLIGVLVDRVRQQQQPPVEAASSERVNELRGRLSLPQSLEVQGGEP